METQQATKWRWLILASSTLETFLFGGIVFGWGSLVFILKQEGIFAHLCSDDATKNVTLFRTGSASVLEPNRSETDNVTTDHTFANVSRYDDVSSVMSNGVVTCVLQDEMLSLCFSVTSAILYAATSLAGVIAYKCGTRVSRLTGWVSFTLGCILLAMTSTDNPWLLFGGLAPLGYGGVSLLITNIQVGMLFNKGASTVIATLNGLYDSSSVIMLFFKFAHENGFRRRDSFLVLCGLHVLTLLSTMVLMPRTHFTWTIQQHCVAVSAQSPSSQGDTAEEHEQPLKDLASRDQTCQSTADQNKEDEQEENWKEKEKDDECDTSPAVPEAENGQAAAVPSLRDCVLSTFFLLEVSWFALLQMRFSFFLTTYNPWLSSMFRSEEDVSHYTNVSLYSMMAGLPISLVSGTIFDFFKLVFAQQSVPERRNLYPSVIMLALTSSLAVLLSVSVLLDSRSAAVLASCILGAGLRSFLYSVDANIITLLFPPRYFTALFSVCDLMGGAVSMLQYAFVVWFNSAGFTVVNSVMLAMAALTFVHPVVQLYRARRTSPPGPRGHSPPEAASLTEDDPYPSCSSLTASQAV